MDPAGQTSSRGVQNAGCQEAYRVSTPDWQTLLPVIVHSTSTSGKGHSSGGPAPCCHALKADFFSCRLATRPTGHHTGLHPLPQSQNQAGYSSEGVACCPGQPRQLLPWSFITTMGAPRSEVQQACCPHVAAGCAGSASCKWHRVPDKLGLHMSACLAPKSSCCGGTRPARLDPPVLITSQGQLSGSRLPGGQSLHRSPECLPT